MKILLIEDDEYTTLLLTQALAAHNYRIETIKDGQAGLELAKAFDYDLLLLDVMLPNMDGISICRQLRAQSYETPILMMTVQDSTNLRVMGLEAGADDYVVKPFVLSELIARIRALLRRGREILPVVLAWENLEFDCNTREVTYCASRLHLTPKEYDLLELFLRNPRKIFSRSKLLDRIWLSSEFPGEEAVTTQIKGLRQKLKAVGMTADLIETVYGLGYRLRESDKKTRTLEPASQRKIPSPRAQELHLAEAEVMTVVTKTWEEFKQNRLGKQYELFEQALAQLSTTTPDGYVLKQAQAEAHRLAGSLGCYGWLEGSKVALEIELLLQNFVGWDQSTVFGLERLEKLIKLLKTTLQQPPSTPAIPPLTSRTPWARLLIIDDDTMVIERIKLEAAAWNLLLEVATDLTAARSILALNPPDVILLDLTFPHTQENGFTLLAELTTKLPEIPVLVFTTDNQLHQRVEAARLGADSFLHKTMTAPEVLSIVRTSLKHHCVTQAKVMVVDDDPLVLNQVNRLLLSWGFQVTTLQHPKRFWEVLEAATPDLLILDIKMPDFSGIELCQAVRNDIRGRQLPVLFLSVHSDAETVHQVYAVGADDYLHKPIVETELISRILNRLYRKQLKHKLKLNVVNNKV